MTPNRNLSGLEAELREICQVIACFVLHNSDNPKLIDPTSIWTIEDRRRLEAELFEIAFRRAQEFAEQGYDPRTVLRAVRFLGNQALPCTKDDAAWFRWGLDALLLQFMPIVVSADEVAFFDEVRAAMDDHLRAEQ